jgi:uncharacterized protein YqgC (DUF456 family)
MVWVYYLLLLVVLITGLLLNVLGLPGLWLMVAGFGGYALLTRWDNYVGWPSLIALVVLGLLAELVEFLAGAAGSKAAGARRRGMIGAIIGGFLGAIFLSIIPIPIVSQIVGACLGAFLGAAIMEFSDKDLRHAARVGYGAAKGRLWGIVSKLAFGCVMLIVAVFAALPIGSATVTPNPPPPTTLTTPPATAPATTTSVD